MGKYALGLLETLGYPPAITALDAALKTAAVSLKGIQRVGAGLVTILIEGDVAAVQTAIEAGNMAAQTLGTVVSCHVIPRPDDQLELLMHKPGAGVEKRKSSEATSAAEVPTAPTAEAVIAPEEMAEDEEIITEIERTIDEAIVEPVPKTEEAMVETETDQLIEKQQDTGKRESNGKPLLIPYGGKEIKISSKKDLYRIKVVELRKIARGLKGFPMEAKKIKFANKTELVEGIFSYLKMEVE